MRWSFPPSLNELLINRSHPPWARAFIDPGR